MLHRTLILGVALALSHMAAAADTKVLFIGAEPDHPHGAHMYMHTSNMLAKCLKLSDGVESVVSLGWPEDTQTLDGVNTIVVYSSPGAEFLLDSPHRKEFAETMQRGVGLMTIHWASTVKQDNFERLAPEWIGYLGGTWISNVGLHTGKSPLKLLVPDHPICRGWQGYEIHDEYYLNPEIPDATPLLQVVAEEKPVVVGWAYERPGGGRSYATTLGHYYRNFQQEAFRRMIINGILWTAEREVPAAGAPVALSEADLALPPEPGK